MRVPFSDISFDREEIDAVSETLESGWPSRGEVSAEFEAALAKYLGSNVALVNSGSSALLCALLANEVKAGDTVLVPDFTFVATASIPAILGCKIRPVDCDLETFNVRGIAGKNWDAAVLTDVAGQPFGIANYKNQPIVEDAAEAFGAERYGYRIGATEWLTCFSFNITKTLSTVEGGAIASSNEELIERCRSTANYGRTKEQYVHDRLGLNLRTTDIQSALGLISLKRLDKNLARRAEISDRYKKELPMFRFQQTPAYVSKKTNFMVIALTDRRDFWIRKFRNAGIDARTVFWPIHLQPCFQGLPRCPNAETIYNQALSLPIYSSMKTEDVEYVIATANED